MRPSALSGSLRLATSPVPGEVECLHAGAHPGHAAADIPLDWSQAALL